MSDAASFDTFAVCLAAKFKVDWVPLRLLRGAGLLTLVVLTLVFLTLVFLTLVFLTLVLLVLEAGILMVVLDECM
jgi:hypothetical protein